MSVRVAMVLGVLAGCFDPQYHAPRCGPGGECPPGMFCRSETCAASPNDAPDASPDAAHLMGLGQVCGAGMQCPASSPVCLTRMGQTVGFCSLLCHADATVMSNAQGMIGVGTNTMPDDPKCVAISMATVGTPICDVPHQITPPIQNPVQPNTTFTYQVHCVIGCGAGNACPSGLMCNTMVGWCVPN